MKSLKSKLQRARTNEKADPLCELNGYMLNTKRVDSASDPVSVNPTMMKNHVGGYEWHVKAG